MSYLYPAVSAGSSGNSHIRGDFAIYLAIYFWGLFWGLFRGSFGGVLGGVLGVIALCPALAYL
jgi:hypothetical protein